MLDLPSAKYSKEPKLFISQYTRSSCDPQKPFWLGFVPYVDHCIALGNRPSSTILASLMLFAKLGNG
jgi:hypothetical protein